MTSQRQTWDTVEDGLLQEAVSQCQMRLGRIDWPLVALHVPGRDRKACRKRWCDRLGAQHNRGRWTAEEDERLRHAYSIWGPKWTRVAELVRSRSENQCLKRWRDALDPEKDIERPWTEQEDAQLSRIVDAEGPNWTSIASQYFPDRTGLVLRHRQQALQLRRQSEANRAAVALPILFLNPGADSRAAM